MQLRWLGVLRLWNKVQNKLIIFDFDGTLADSFNLFVEAFNEAAATYRFQPFDIAKTRFGRSNATKKRKADEAALDAEDTEEQAYVPSSTSDRPIAPCKKSSG